MIPRRWPAAPQRRMRSDFTQDQGGFSGVTDDQAFYLDADGNPVLF